MKKEYLTTTQAAKILGISRMQILRRIKKGEIKADKIGRNFVILEKDLSPIYKPLSKEEEQKISSGVEKIVSEYGDALKKLGRE